MSKQLQPMGAPDSAVFPLTWPFRYASLNKGRRPGQETKTSLEPGKKENVAVESTRRPRGKETFVRGGIGEVEFFSWVNREEGEGEEEDPGKTFTFRIGGAKKNLACVGRREERGKRIWMTGPENKSGVAEMITLLATLSNGAENCEIAGGCYRELRGNFCEFHLSKLI